MLTVITGPPCSGKTTYARQHARPGDITVDFDAIAGALGSQVAHQHSGHIWHVTLAARNAAITQAVQQHHQGARVWIIDCTPTRNRRLQYDANGARWVTLTADRAELHRRADAERPAEWHARIDQWLDSQGQHMTAGDPAPVSRTRW